MVKKNSTFFCRLPLTQKEAIAFLHLFFHRPRDLELSVFDICFVNLDALFERVAFLPRLLPDAPLLAYPTLRFCPLKGFQRILFWPCANRDADFFSGVDFLVVVVVVNFIFFL